MARRDSQEPVPPNGPQEYRIEIYPASNVFEADHRIRLTIATADTPATMTRFRTCSTSSAGRCGCSAGRSTRRTFSSR
jgi:predicted acyl esterase